MAKSASALIARLLPIAALLPAILLPLTSCAPGARTPTEETRAVIATPDEATGLTDREYLVRKASSGTRSERMEALSVMARLKDRGFVPVLLDRIEKEDDRFLQVEILNALAATDDPRGIGAARWLLGRHSSDRVGVEAARCLHELGDDSGANCLIRNLERADEPELVVLSHSALKRIFDVDLPPSASRWARHYRLCRAAKAEGWTWSGRDSDKAAVPAVDMRLRRHRVGIRDFWKDGME